MIFRSPSTNHEEHPPSERQSACRTMGTSQKSPRVRAMNKMVFILASSSPLRNSWGTLCLYQVECFGVFIENSYISCSCQGLLLKGKIIQNCKIKTNDKAIFRKFTLGAMSSNFKAVMTFLLITLIDRAIPENGLFHRWKDWLLDKANGETQADETRSVSGWLQAWIKVGRILVNHEREQQETLARWRLHLKEWGR